MNNSAATTPVPKPLAFSLLRLLGDGEFHSGEVLAQRLGVSRASVNNALHNVEQYGLTLYSVRGRGYRLAEAPQWLEAELVQKHLGAHAADFSIEIADHATSSNSLMLQSAARNAASGSVLAVEWQSSGRGRLGRSWHSGLGNALTFSLLWRFDCGLSGLSGLSLAAGVALIRVLRQCGAAEVSLKWPNDVVTPQGKLAGILIEAQGDMLGPSAVVIGVGLNLRLPHQVLQQIDQPVADLAQLVKLMPERNELLAKLLGELAQVLQEFSRHGFAGLRDEWESYHLYQNKEVRLHMPGGSDMRGEVLGVTAEGALLLETPCRLTGQPEIRVFNAGEISLRDANHVAA